MPARGESMIERVVRVLETLGAERRPRTASEIARQAGIPGPSAHRIVADLVEAGVLERDADRRVRLGMRLWEIVARSSDVSTLRETAMPYLEALRSSVDAATLLTVLDGDDALNVCTLSPRASSATNVSHPGVRLPALASTPGVVLTAFAPPDVRDRILEAGKITRFTDLTPTDRDEVRRIVLETRHSGHVIGRGWMSPDATGVAVPVLADDGTAFAALSVTTPFEASSQTSLLPALHATAGRIARAVVSGSQYTDPRMTVLLHRIRLSTGRA